MEINDTSKISSFYPKTEVKGIKKSSAKTSTSDVSAQSAGTSALQKQDTFVREETVQPTDTGIYSKESITKTIEELEDQRTQAFVSMIEKMFQSQSNSEFLSVGDIIKETLQEADRIKEVANHMRDGLNDPLCFPAYRDFVYEHFSPLWD